MFNRFALFVLACVVFSSAISAAESEVEKKGQTGKIKVEQLIAGHLAELNGRYKLRVTEVTYEQGGYIGPHHHAGPGIRCVTTGQLTYVQPDKTSVYGPGDCFFESGDISHTATNKTDKPVVLLNFELLPADFKGPTSIPVPQ